MPCALEGRTPGLPLGSAAQAPPPPRPFHEAELQQPPLQLGAIDAVTGGVVHANFGDNPRVARTRAAEGGEALSV